MITMRAPTKGAGALCRVLYVPVFSDQVGLSAVTYGGKQAEYKFKTFSEVCRSDDNTPTTSIHGEEEGGLHIVIFHCVWVKGHCMLCGFQIWKRAQAEGKTLREKLNLFGADLQVRLVYEWQQCEAAPSGTWKNYLVLYVLSSGSYARRIHCYFHLLTRTELVVVHCAEDPESSYLESMRMKFF